MKKIFTVILTLGMLFLSACSKPPAIEAQIMDEIPVMSQTEPESEMTTESPTEEPAENYVALDSPESETENTPEPAEDIMIDEETAMSRMETDESDLPQSVRNEEPSVSASVIIEFVEERDTAEQEIPAQSAASEVTPAPKPEPDESAEGELTAPPTPETTPVSTPEPTPEPELEFDVSYWVSFAKSYGQQVGLSYDSQATSCWDNPIIASPHSIYLERDITSRLSRYVREGMTAFCVWSEQLPDGRYNIYIGYA